MDSESVSLANKAVTKRASKRIVRKPSCTGRQIADWLLEEVDRRLEQAKEEGKRSGWCLRLGGMGLPGRRVVLRWLVLVAVRRAQRNRYLYLARVAEREVHQDAARRWREKAAGWLDGSGHAVLNVESQTDDWGRRRFE